ncbi:stage VI sporulation protein D [Salirhabdus euzebyi]|uniref:Stage VI sporulation protein D n=1 Tax=Salirhabdus euzebyi TaxID=394506 RepID=A0A841PT15_9BACI|nr:stage VI sporulation protein D [Salirhabdus euzebyi]MBB6451930.1 stage VI sporulation protein D [Salirhabdus euzebyi]
MTQDHRNVFTFDLNELLWFEKGQEVQELIGIALEPDITINENEDYVSVRGVIELTGEYMPTISEQGEKYEDQVVSFQDHSTKNFIRDIRSFDDGLNEFHYNIPVEITIPKYRVSSLDDVLVEIDYFDYEIPDTSHLKLQAQVVISGIEQDQAYSPRTEEEVQEEATDNTWDEVSQPFSFDMKFEEDEESSSILEEDSPIEELLVEESRDEEEPVEQKEKEKGRDLWFKKKSQSFGEFFGNKEEVEEELEDSPFESPFDSSYESSNVESPTLEVEYHMEGNDESPSPDSRENAVYLVNMFDREEDTYSRIRMCIVQDSDTLDTIAKRYSIPKMSLVRYNNLESEVLNAGEILYIPQQKPQKDPS